MQNIWASPGSNTGLGELQQPPGLSKTERHQGTGDRAWLQESEMPGQAAGIFSLQPKTSEAKDVTAQGTRIQSPQSSYHIWEASIFQESNEA